MKTSLSRALAEIMGDEEFAGTMESLALRFAEYRERLPLIPYAYSRTRLHLAPHYEIVVMQWAPGSTSAIHDHGRSRCWVLMLAGTLEVENFVHDGDLESDVVVLKPAERLVLRDGDIDHRLGPHELHRVNNTSSESAYSLQLYSEPIATYSIVDEHSQKRRVVTAICDLDLRAD